LLLHSIDHVEADLPRERAAHTLSRVDENAIRREAGG
jgi:hypothetical protein